MVTDTEESRSSLCVHVIPECWHWGQAAVRTTKKLQQTCHCTLITSDWSSAGPSVRSWRFVIGDAIMYRR